MTCAEIALYLADHTTYHRGYIADMLFQAHPRRAAEARLISRGRREGRAAAFEREWPRRCPFPNPKPS